MAGRQDEPEDSCTTGVEQDSTLGTALLSSPSHCQMWLCLMFLNSRVNKSHLRTIKAPLWQGLCRVLECGIVSLYLVSHEGGALVWIWGLQRPLSQQPGLFLSIWLQVPWASFYMQRQLPHGVTRFPPSCCPWGSVWGHGLQEASWLPLLTMVWQWYSVSSEHIQATQEVHHALMS